MEEKDKTSEFLDLEIKINYNKYKEFDIDLEAFEDELNSIILPNKRLFYDSDYNNKIIYSFDTFRGKNNNLLNNFIIKYQDYIEEINCEEKIKQIMNEPNNEINEIYIRKIDSILMNNVLEYLNNEELNTFNKIIIAQFKNSKIEINKRIF